LALVTLLSMSAVVLIHCIQLYMENHMYLSRRSNAGLPDIHGNRLYRYCSKSTNGSRWDVERKQKNLNRGRGIRELDQEGNDSELV